MPCSIQGCNEMHMPLWKACLASEEEQDIALRLSQMDLHDRNQRCVHVVRLGRLGVQDLHWVRPARDGKNRAAEEVARELQRHISLCASHTT